jgi:hypothetical protein
VITVASCGGSTSSLDRSGVNGSSDSEASIADCSGYQSEMTIPYGISTATGQLLAGKKFAKIVAVDSQDGRMKVTILPPDGQNVFAATLIDELVAQGYTIRIVACRENTSSVVSGFSTTGVCNSSAPINLVGKPEVVSSDFASEGFTAEGTKVHSTMSFTGESSLILKPNFIMITAGLIEQNQVGEFMIAYGRSPYYNGCYNK